MQLIHENIGLKTIEPIQLIDLTDRVNRLIKKSGIQEGFIVVSSSHTTAGIRVNEKCGELESDFRRFVTELTETDYEYHHNKVALDGRPNAHSHLIQFLIGHQETLVINKGVLRLGTWQSLFFVELDGPRDERQVLITLMGV